MAGLERGGKRWSELLLDFVYVLLFFFVLLLLFCFFTCVCLCACVYVHVFVCGVTIYRATSVSLPPI